MQDTDDLRIRSLHPLLPPEILAEEIPIADRASQVVSEARRQAEAILEGEDDRLLVVAGPCSIHDPQAAQEYGGKLLGAAQDHRDDLLVAMRVYFEKPRTTVGWKGLINDPALDGSFQINRGLRMARKLLLDLAESGLPAGSEFLDTIIPQFTADLVSWGAIGARTTESQVHRELASGLSMPVGFKNGTNGSIQIAIDAVRASRQKHRFLSVTKQGLAAIVETTGNDRCHLILRGSSQGPNYDAESIGGACRLLDQAGLHPRLMVDCSHGNSAKDHRRQPGVAAEIARQVGGGSHDVFGVMIESHLVEGSQRHSPDQPMVHGQSITDSCVSWETTLGILEELSRAVRTRRRAGG